LDKIKGKNATDAEQWLRERYPLAYTAYEEKKERNRLPLLQISSEKLKGGENQSSTSPTNGIWLITYSSGVLRTYLIYEERKVRFPSVGLAQGDLVEKDGHFLLEFGDGKLERLRFQGNTLHLEHFDPANRYPGSPTLTGTGKRLELPNSESRPDNGEYAKFQGRWTVSFPDEVYRIYVIDSKGNFRCITGELVLQGRLKKKGTDVLADGNANEIERLTLSDGKLCVEIYRPANSYPQTVALTGYGERTK